MDSNKSETSPETPVISIITVVYNGVMELETTFLSVFSQTFTNYEYIIIDGGSKDGTLDIIKKYEEQITVSISEPDHGIYDAMNKGLQYATGKWILFLNAGDRLYNNETLGKAKDYLEKYSASDLLFGNVLMIQSDGSEKIRKLNNTILFLIRNMICHQCIFYSKELFLKIGLFDSRYRLAADFEHLVRAQWSGLKITKIPEIIARYNLNGVSSRKENISKIWKERVEIFGRKPKKMNVFIYYIFLGYAKAAYQFRKAF